MIQHLPSPYNFRGQEPQLLPSSIHAAADDLQTRREDIKVKTRMRLLSVSLLLFAALFCVFSAPSARAEAQAPPQTEELYLERSGKKLYGKLYLPEDATSPLPLVILSHGLGSNHHIMEPYAEFFADSGIAAFVFDYIGGSEESLSDGDMKDLSVLTEAADLSFLLDHFLADARFMEDGIFLFGGSQGGFISAFVAGKRSADTAGLILLYPAFNLQDICRELAAQGEIPDNVTIGEHVVGRAYVEDMLTFDIYKTMAQYTGPALLFHGTDDPYVPPDYSRRAADILGAELIVVEGAGHGFTGEDRERVARRSVDFVRDVLSAQSFSAAA